MRKFRTIPVEDIKTGQLIAIPASKDPDDTDHFLGFAIRSPKSPKTLILPIVETQTAEKSISPSIDRYDITHERTLEATGLETPHSVLMIGTRIKDEDLPENGVLSLGYIRNDIGAYKQIMQEAKAAAERNKGHFAFSPTAFAKLNVPTIDVTPQGRTPRADMAAEHLQARPPKQEIENPFLAGDPRDEAPARWGSFDSGDPRGPEYDDSRDEAPARWGSFNSGDPQPF